MQTAGRQSRFNENDVITKGNRNTGGETLTKTMNKETVGLYTLGELSKNNIQV